MPAKSEAQRRLMAAAEHGATFPKAKSLRKSMTKDQLHDFASSHPSKNLGKHLHSRGGGSVATRIRERMK